MGTERLTASPGSNDEGVYVRCRNGRVGPLQSEVRRRVAVEPSALGELSSRKRKGAMRLVPQKERPHKKRRRQCGRL
jgi:hypothetical protein